MIAAKQPTFRSFSVVAILAQKLRKDFLACWLKPSDDDALCAVEALQSKLSLQKPITTQLSRLSSFFDNRNNNVYIPHSKNMYFLREGAHFLAQ